MNTHTHALTALLPSEPSTPVTVTTWRSRVDSVSLSLALVCVRATYSSHTLPTCRARLFHGSLCCSYRSSDVKWVSPKHSRWLMAGSKCSQCFLPSREEKGTLSFLLNTKETSFFSQKERFPLHPQLHLAQVRSIRQFPDFALLSLQKIP